MMMRTDRCFRSPQGSRSRCSHLRIIAGRFPAGPGEARSHGEKAEAAFDGALDRVEDDTILFKLFEICGMRAKSPAEEMTILGSTTVSVI
jgi:hypothetical protein